MPKLYDYISTLKIKIKFLSKSKNYTKTTKSNYISKKFAFFTSKVKLTLILLRQIFTKILILTYFKPDSYI